MCILDMKCSKILSLYFKDSKYINQSGHPCSMTNAFVLNQRTVQLHDPGKILRYIALAMQSRPDNFNAFIIWNLCQ